MPAKWQRWIPFEIDAFFGSTAVQAMHPAAQMGYWRLICAQWQSEDCALSADPFDLAEKSGLGDELWAQYGPRILRQFKTLSARSAEENLRSASEMIRNAVCYEKWEEARNIAERRKVGAQRTNSARSAEENGSLSARSADASRAGVRALVPVSVDVSVGTSVNPESGGELIAANHLLEELGVVADNSVRRVAADAIRLLAKEGGDVRTATEYILSAGRSAVASGEIINRFWFTDQRYRPPAQAPPRKSARQKRIEEWEPGND